MKRIIGLALFALLLAGTAAQAVDNTLLVTPCASNCITPRTIDVGSGVQAPAHILINTSGTALATPASGADGVSNTTAGLQTYNFPLVYNGTTWDRLRGDATNGVFVNVKAGTVAATQSGTWNVTNISGTVSLPTGAATSANQTSELTKLDSIIANTGAALTAGTAVIGKVGIDQTTPGTTNAVQLAAALPAGSNVIGFTTNDPCTSGATKTAVPISQTANTKLFSATSAKKNYICSFAVIAADAENISLMEGTGTVCASATQTGLIGGITAANGLNLAANGGITLGNGGFTIAAGATVNTDVCLFQSGSGRVAGVLVYVQQ